MSNTCKQVDQFCISPANLSPNLNIKSICFCCKEYVCIIFSSKRKYLNYGKVRLCNDCQIEYDGSDKIVMKRLYKLAGVK